MPARMTNRRLAQLVVMKPSDLTTVHWEEIKTELYRLRELEYVIRAIQAKARKKKEDWGG